MPRRAQLRELGGVRAEDKRSLRAAGRTEQFNIRTRAEVKAAAFEHAQRRGFKTVSEFVEAAIEAFIEQEGNEGGA